MSVSPTLQADSPTQVIHWIFDDGGRKAAGFKGDTRDCVTRAIAIVTKQNYREVYDDLFELGRELYADRYFGDRLTKMASPRTGVFGPVSRTYLQRIGWVYTPLVPSVHLRRHNLPSDWIIAVMSGHFAAVVNGTLYDTHDSSHGGTRLVHGYWSKP